MISLNRVDNESTVLGVINITVDGESIWCSGGLTELQS